MAFWLTVTAGLTAADLYFDRNDCYGDTLSECTRFIWRTETPVGRVAFIASWAALSTWFVPHICRIPDYDSVPGALIRASLGGSQERGDRG